MTSEGSWPALKSSALYTDARGSMWAVGTDLGDHWALGLDTRDAIALPFAVKDAWTAAPGRSYLAVDDRRAIVLAEGNRFTAVYADISSRTRITSVEKIAGRAGPSADADELAFVAELDDERCVVGRRRGGAWSEEPLAAAANGLAIAPGGAVVVAQHRIFEPAPAPGALVLIDGDAVRSFPVAAGSAPVGVHWLDDEACLVFLVEPDRPATAWIMDRAGALQPVATVDDHPLVPWVCEIRCAAWRGAVYVATTTGVFVLDGERRLRRTSTFKATSLWVVGDALVARGWRGGNPAHEILRDDGPWRDFPVPEPGVVKGARGAAVWLAPDEKVTVVKARIPAASATPARAPAAKAAPTKPAAAISTRFELGAFLAALAAAERSAARASPMDVRGALERALGSTAAADLRRYLDALATHDLAPVGLWRIWNPPDLVVPPVAEDPRGVATTYREPVLSIAAFTGTVAIGADGGGQVYFVDHAPARSEVFIYGPGVGELKPLADSFTSFAMLNDVVERWEALAAARGWDDEDVMEGELDMAEPELAAIRERAAALRGKVNLSGFDGSHVASDFDELVPALAGVKLRRASRSEVLRLHDRAYWVLALLARGAFFAERAQKIQRAGARTDAKSRPAANELYWLWHHYLLGSDAALAPAVARARRATSLLVRETAELLGNAGTDWVRELRDRVKLASR